MMISDVFERHKSITLSILPSQFTTVIQLSIILVSQANLPKNWNFRISKNKIKKNTLSS